MRWGVKKDQYRSYKDKNATRATESKIKRLGSDVNMLRYFTKGAKLKRDVNFNDDWYNNLDTGKQYLKKGALLTRVTRGVDDKALAGRLYVATRKDDANMYRATIPYVQKKGASGKKSYHSVYQVELETKRRLAMPSAKERVDVFIETLQRPDGKKWLKDNGYKGEIDELNAKEVGLKYYQKFNKQAGSQTTKFNDTYFNEIKNRGYKALIDDNDADIWSKEPTIILSPKGDVRIKNVRQLSADEINRAQRKVLKYREYGSERGA